jgi:hypothetical protein
MAARGVLRCYLPDASPARVVIHDVGGRVVRSVGVAAAAGTAEVVWDGRDDAGRALPSGIYFAELRHGGESFRSRVVLLR